MRKLSWIAVLVLLLDQATKAMVKKYLAYHASVVLLPFLNLTLTYNTGAAFGFLSNESGWQNAFFIVVGIVVVAAIVIMVRRLGADDLQAGVSLMLVLGGAAGNIVDRLVRGYVVDFIDLHYRGWHWPAFNVADSAITIGAVLLALDALGLGLRRRPARP